jgi:hypothetical protein
MNFKMIIHGLEWIEKNKGDIDIFKRQIKSINKLKLMTTVRFRLFPHEYDIWLNKGLYVATISSNSQHYNLTQMKDLLQ